MVGKRHLHVIVGSPNDVKEERDIMDDVIKRINQHIANPLGLHLDIVKWEKDAYPDFHPDGTQGVLDPILDFPECDIFIGIFWHKFGTPTQDGTTGTQHEFNLAFKKWQKKQTSHIMFYFNQKEYFPKYSKEAIQLSKVLQFKESFPEEGLYWNYDGKEEFEKLVYDHLANLLNQNYSNKKSKNLQIPEKESHDVFSRPEKFEGEHDIFVGRDTQLKEIIKHLEDFASGSSSNPVTVWGMGGIGKSALAYHAMHEFEKNHTMQIIPLYFEVKPTLDDVLSTIAIHLDLDDTNFVGKDKQEVLLSHMKDKRLLFYADGFESVSEPEEDYKEKSIQMIKFLQRLPSNTMILATSRKNRNFLNEKPIHLEELDTEHAVQLFAQITQTDPESQRPDIEKITSIASNHPLAIEIIAHSYEGQGLANLISDIQKHGIVSSKYGSSSDERQHTVESCIGFSFDRLDSKLQTMLTGLAQLHSPFSNEMAQEVFGAKSSDVPSLYNCTLITRIVKSPYGDLDKENPLYDFHGLVRSYLRKKTTEKLDHGRVIQYYLKFLEETYNSLKQSYTSESVLQLSTILQSEENYIVSIASINDDDAKIQKDAASCFSWIGLILKTLGNYSKALTYHNKALEIDTELGDRVGIGADHGNIGVVLDNMGRHQDALDSYNKALEIRTELGDRVGIGADHTNIGVVLDNMGRHQDALDSYNKALEIHTELGDRVGIGADHTNIGVVLDNMGRHQDALDSYNKALEIDTELGDRVGVEKDYSGIGIVLKNMGRHQEALDSHNKALEISTDLGDNVGNSRNYANIGNVLDNMGRHQEALDSYNKALEIDTELGDRVGIVIDCRNIGLVLEKTKRIDEARNSFNKGLDILKDLEKTTGYRHPLYDRLINDLNRIDTSV